MNQTQIKYAQERAKAIHAKRNTALREEHSITAVRLTTDQKYAALKAGEFSILPKGKRYGGSHWHHDIVFNNEIIGGLNHATYDPAKATLDATFTKLNDELVLGDNELALALLQAFEA